MKNKKNCVKRNILTIANLVNTNNPYLRHFGNVMERHFWTKNPQSHFWFWWRHTSIQIFYFMLIWNLLSSTNCTPLGLITWRHYPEISCDEHKCTRKPGNMVERHLWTKNPPLFFTRKNFAELLEMLFEFFKKKLCGFFVQKWRSTIFPVCGFFVHNSRIGVKRCNIWITYRLDEWPFSPNRNLNRYPDCNLTRSTNRTLIVPQT